MQRAASHMCLLFLLICVGCHSGGALSPGTFDLSNQAEPPSGPPAGGNASQNAPVTKSLDDHFFIGSVSEDSSSDLNFWRQHGAGLDAATQIAARYIYLNGGFRTGWRTWSNADGGRVTHYIRNSFDLGMTPFFVYFQIAEEGASDFLPELSHVQDPDFTKAYFNDLKFFLGLVRQEAKERKVGIILEPDFLGYMMQNNKPVDSTFVAVSSVYDSGILDRTQDPIFPDTLQGLVNAVNYMVLKFAPNAVFGWQINLWASPGKHHPIPSNGIIHLTDSMGLDAGRAAIRDEATEVALYYKNAGILNYGAKWAFVDKYGLDGAAAFCSDPLNNPSGCRWFWNSDHWNNYIAFLGALKEGLQTPIVLWQIPIGHLNRSVFNDPASGVLFTELRNTDQSYEDTALNFILGDAFQQLSFERQIYFTHVADPKTSWNNSITAIESHIPELAQAGVAGILFGAGVAQSTRFDTDGGLWMAKVKEYYRRGPLGLPLITH